MTSFLYFIVIYNSTNENKITKNQAFNNDETVQETASHRSIQKVKENKEVVTRVDKQNKEIIIRNSFVERKPEAVGQLYKWKDANNITVISMDPPPSNIERSVFLFSRKSPLDESTVEVPQISTAPKADGLLKSTVFNNPLKVYTPKGLKEFIEYSQDIGEKIEIRGEELSELVNQL